MSHRCGKPVIAVLGEYDALPGLSQKCQITKEPVTPGAAGHGCGHNLLGAGAVTGAIMIKRFLEQEGIPGTLRFYGCPEEELLSGKVKMAYYHMFDGCDMALSWHPMSANMIYDEGYLASASAKFYFKGKTSHAAFAPERGRMHRFSQGPDIFSSFGCEVLLPDVLCFFRLLWNQCPSL